MAPRTSTNATKLLGSKPKRRQKQSRHHGGVRSIDALLGADQLEFIVDRIISDRLYKRSGGGGKSHRGHEDNLELHVCEEKMRTRLVASVVVKIRRVLLVAVS